MPCQTALDKFEKEDNNKRIPFRMTEYNYFGDIRFYMYIRHYSLFKHNPHFNLNCVTLIFLGENKT